MLKKLRPAISVVLLAIALSIGIYYLVTHRNLLRQLAHIHPLIICLVLISYAFMFVVLLVILDANLRLCNLKINILENAKLNAHSLLINFFVPGQAGPAYRGAYLYKRHKLRIKNYVITTLLYYVIYALISVFLLLVIKFPWWQTLGALIIIAGLGIAAIRKYSSKVKINAESLDLKPIKIIYLFAATLLQAFVQVVIYSIELHSANPHIHLSQIITYTGTANLALFVALTPGAIGIRESFLIFTEHLHHISSPNIIYANVIDRSVYLVFLLILIALTVTWQLFNKIKRQNLNLKETADVK